MSPADSIGMMSTAEAFGSPKTFGSPSAYMQVLTTFAKAFETGDPNMIDQLLKDGRVFKVKAGRGFASSEIKGLGSRSYRSTRAVFVTS